MDIRPRRDLRSRLSLALQVLVSLLLGLAVLWPVSRFLQVAFARVTYPFELEWMEGGVVDHLRIVLSGQSLYREPSLDFAPFIYMPGYYYLSAIVAKVVGIGFFAPRLVSLISILGCFAILARWVHRETNSVLAGLVATGLFAATYGQSAFWFDLARVDSLLLLFVLAGYLLARFSSSRRQSALCGLFFACAVLTKQVGLVLAVPALGFVWMRSRRLGLWAAACFVGVVGVSFGLLEATSHGWFSFYAFRVPADHQILWADWRTDLLQYFWNPVAPMVLCGIAVASGSCRRAGLSVWALHSGWVLCAAVTAYSSLLHTGGYSNVLMPAHAALATSAGLVFASLWRPDGVASRSGARLLGCRLFAAATVLIQLALLPAIRTRDLVPSNVDRAAEQAMLAAVKASPGPVWMVSSGYYPLLTHGAGVTAHAMSFADIFKSKRETVKQHLRDDLIARIRAKSFGTIVLDRAGGFLPGEIINTIHENYRLKQRLFQSDDAHVWPKSGANVRPDEIWEPIVAQPGTRAE